MALSPVAIDLDRALGDTRPLWDDFLVDAARRYASIAPLDPAALPEDRGVAAEELDRWAELGVGDWRGALERFAEDRDEGLVDLVRDREEGREEERSRGAACGAVKERAEECVLRRVGDLPENRVPGSQAGPKIRHR